MDILALIGAVLAFAAIIIGNSLEGGQFAALVNAPAFIIVVGGTLGAIVLQTPLPRLSRAAQLLVWVILP
ncbi:MAG: flagellar motor protein, partial [Pseudomonadales bacterium]